MSVKSKTKNKHPVIVLDSSWNMFMMNGLVDLNRDVLMKVVKIIDDDEKIRNVCKFVLFVCFF